MEFLLTPAHINVFARQPAGKTPIKQGNSFSFDGDDPIEFEDADSTLHFFFPKDYAHAVGDSLTGFSSRVSLRRYFYSDRGKDYMLVGVPWNWIDSAPEGDLIIDPTTSVATSEDVWLESTSNNDGNSAGLLIGKAADPYPKKRTIIKFNIAGSGIPSSATVLNAQMKLYYYSAANGGSGSWVDRWVQAHQLLVNWAEAQATRDNRLTGTPWNVAYVGLNDIDAKSGYESTLLFQSGQTGTWKAWNLTAVTQKWVNGTATNYGVVLWATNETTNGYDLRFHSSDAPPPNNANPPYLEVIYSTDAATKTVYFLKDHLGSIRATVLDSATAPVIGYDDYDPWGYPLALRTKAIPNAYLQGASKNKFTGKERDDEYGLNLDYFGARYYDWLIGRWISVDPLWQKHLDVTPYNYVLNNPLLLIDPDGQQVRAYVKYTAPPTFAEIKQNFAEKAALSAAYASSGLNQMAVGTLALGVLEAAGSALANLDPFGISGLANPILMAESAVVRGGAAVGEAAEAVSKTANVAEGVAGAAERGSVVIGKMDDLAKPGAIKSGERMLDLPNQGIEKLNWKQNASKLREAIREGRPIRDASINPKTGALMDNTGFLRAERDLLKNRGWKYDSNTGYWHPPEPQ